MIDKDDSRNADNNKNQPKIHTIEIHNNRIISFWIGFNRSTIFDWNTIGIEDDDVKCKIKAFTVLLFICFLTALVWGLHSSKEVTILSEDDVEIIVRYDDLMKIAFPKKPQTERIVVIAVNCCYDTVVNDDIIHEGSVHGQFLKRFAYSDEKRQALDAEIESSLKAFGYEYEDISLNEKREGKRKDILWVQYPE